MTERKPLNPQFLTLARQARRVTQTELAQRLNVTQGSISKIEAGLSEVTDEELQRIADALDYPLGFFKRERRVEGPGVTELYHNRKREKASIGLLHCAYANASIREMNIDDLLRSWDWDFDDFPTFPTDQFGHDPMKVARTTRAIWRLPPGTVHNVTDSIESAGGIVMTCDFGTRFIFGFSRHRRDAPPLFFLNQNLLPDQWRWTLCHELGHAVMHSNTDPFEGMELEADAFAGEFLMPTQEIKPELYNVTLQKLAGLKRQWKVSMQAILMHAHRIGAITTRQRAYFFMQLNGAGYKMREPAVLDPPVEVPALAEQIVNFHRRKLGYSDDDLRRVLDLNPSDFHAWYGESGNRLRVISE